MPAGKGFLDIHPAATPDVKAYSYYLKVQAAFWIPIFMVAYTLKWGVAWHNAGVPLEPFWKADFHPYWNMIMVVYTGFGFFTLFMSYDPLANKLLLSLFSWFLLFLHGCTALLAVFTSQTDNYVGPILGGMIDIPPTLFGLKNGDKFFVVSAWFGMAGANIYFMKKVFGDYNFPWYHMLDGNGKAMV